MVYGYYITDAVSNERFFTEGCSYCRMSTGGQHESNGPCKDIKVADRKSPYIPAKPYAPVPLCQEIYPISWR